MDGLEEQSYQLFCMRPACGKVLRPDEAYFCSQSCLDLYDPGDLNSLEQGEREQVRQTAAIREERMDRLRASDPERHLAPPDWRPEEPQHPLRVL